MSDDKKLTDEKLEEHLQQGLTQSQIAYKYGYGQPSAALSRRINAMGYQKRNKLNFTSRGSSATLSLDGDTLETALKHRGLEDRDEVFFETNVKPSGRIILDLYDTKWAKKE